MAFLFNLDLTELAIIVIGSIILFGRDLPQVAMKGAAQFMRLRRQLAQMWRDAGLEEEMRKVRRDLDASVPKLPPAGSFFDPANPAGSQPDDLASSLKPVEDSSYLEPDEDPDERAEWELEDAYGPLEEELRAADPEPDPEPEQASEAPESLDELDETPKDESA